MNLLSAFASTSHLALAAIARWMAGGPLGRTQRSLRGSEHRNHSPAKRYDRNQNGSVPDSIHAADLCGRCLFRNHCLTIRLLGLPCGRDVGASFAGCSGLLMVTHGQLEVETAGLRRVVGEGEAWPLPTEEAFHLWVEDTTDVVFFERQ